MYAQTTMNTRSLLLSHRTLDHTESMHFLTQAKAVSMAINANRRGNLLTAQ